MRAELKAHFSSVKLGACAGAHAWNLHECITVSYTHPLNKYTTCLIHLLIAVKRISVDFHRSALWIDLIDQINRWSQVN